MLIKRIAAFLISTAMIAGMMPVVVFAKGIDYEPDEAGTAETTETVAKETAKPKETAPSKPKTTEPEATEPKATEPKAEEPKATEPVKTEAPETEAPKETEAPAETRKESEPKASEPKETEPEESEPEETGSKETEPSGSKETDPADSKETVPSETEPSGSGETEGSKPSETEPSETEPSETEPSETETSDSDSGKAAVSAEHSGPSRRIKGSKPLDNAGLFNQYVNDKFYAKQFSKTRKNVAASSKLTTVNKKIFDKVYSGIVKIAEGEETSTDLIYTVEELGIDIKNMSWSAEDLGVSAIAVYDESQGEYFLTEEALNAAFDLIDPDAIVNALLADCPYQLYWYDKTQGLYYSSVSARGFRLEGSSEWRLCFTQEIRFAFTVAQDYGKGELVTDPTQINKAKTAVAKADSIVSNAKSKSDYEKLRTYCNEICSLVAYNHDAAAGGDSVPYGDPWQLVWVFDGDKNTNVVCEGYSKAFKYLCDKTVFSKKISCMLATGDVVFPGASGAHMWNIVTMEDGKNYIVDVTNSDYGYWSDYDLFLIGCVSGSKDEGYTTKGVVSKDTVIYYYDTDTLNTFDKELVLSNENYDYGFREYDGNYYRINNTASGTGTATFLKPKYQFESVVIPNYIDIEGSLYRVTSIASKAFYQDTVLKAVSIGSNVTVIGDNAFYGCTSLWKVSGGSRVQVIGRCAFAYCSRLSAFTITSATLRKISPYAFNKDGRLKTLNIKKTKKLTKGGVKKSLKGSSVKVVKVKKSKIKKYKKIFKKKNSGRKVKVKK